MECQTPVAFWSVPAADLLKQLDTSPQGLSQDEAKQRLAQFGANQLGLQMRTNTLIMLLSQYKSPIILILFFACGLSFALGDQADALIILIILLVSGLLSFWQELGASDAVAKLLAIVQITATVQREGTAQEISVEWIVPGDVVLLKAGDVIPGDCALLESKDLFVDEAILTGETFPVEKMAGVVPADAGLSQRTSSLFMGTHVVSGVATVLVVCTGGGTEFGKVSARLKLRAPETEFERGVRQFGYLLMEVTLLLVIAIFAINVYLARPVLEAFLFSLALAVGLTPQLLPAIISINLAKGAKRMALNKVIVKRLASIENFGSMNVLCADKTGTLTAGVVELHSAQDLQGQQSDKVLLYAYLNSYFESGFANPIDQAVRRHYSPDLSGYRKLKEVPYDFVRKRLSILVATGDGDLMITKGALANVLAVCSSAETATGEVVDLSKEAEGIQQKFAAFSDQGLRTLGVAYRRLGPVPDLTKDQETSMTFLGFLVVCDPPKPGVAATIEQMQRLGVTLKIITGDNALVAANVAGQVGLASPRLLTGPQIREMSDAALLQQVNETQVFAEVEPNQKEHLISTLRRAGNVVGFMGDGINDASALHAADVSISVDSAVDVAKEAADIVLLEKDLAVLTQGIREGRMTFANTMKYVFMATSANFGNMFSMAGASLFLPFLPLLPRQILLTNLMTDFPEMTIATDSVDPELVDQPQRWDIRFIRRFMVVFGITSSVFDYLTFGVLLWILHATTEQFRTGWFQESVISAALIVLVIRTRRPFVKSMPGKYLFWTTMLIAGATLAFPYTPLAPLFEFKPLSGEFLLMMGGVVILYILSAELMKKIFYRWLKTKGRER